MNTTVYCEMKVKVDPDRKSTRLQHRVICTIQLIHYFTTTDRPSLSSHNTLRYSFTRPIIDTVPSALYCTSKVMPESIILRVRAEASS